MNYLYNYTISSTLIGLESCGVKATSHAQPIHGLLQLPIWVSCRYKSSVLKRLSTFGGVHDPILNQTHPTPVMQHNAGLKTLGILSATLLSKWGL